LFWDYPWGFFMGFHSRISDNIGGIGDMEWKNMEIKWITHGDIGYYTRT
jgi:hypothetical protein